MKKKIRKTGEIVDVVTYVGGTSKTSMDEIMCIDSKGEEKCLKLNYYWDLEDLDEFSICDYWDNFRNEAAVRIYSHRVAGFGANSSINSPKIMDISIKEADELIMKLKNSKK
jgi:hypothetical protein